MARVFRRGLSVLLAAAALSIGRCAPVYQVDGMTLSLGLVHRQNDGSPSEAEGASTSTQPPVLVTDLGYQVTLSRAYYTASSLEIFPCQTGFWSRPGAVFRGLGVAWAHTSGSPTRLGEPQVDSLLRPDHQVLPWARLFPPPGDYCTAELRLEPADFDAGSLPPDVDMVGRTLYLEGTWQQAGTTGTETFSISSAGVAVARFDLLEPSSFPSGLSLSESTPEAELDIDLEYAGWMDGVDFIGMYPSEQADQVMANVARSIGRY